MKKQDKHMGAALFKVGMLQPSPFLKTLTETREEPGSSNAGKYPNVKKSDFCGPSGGAAAGTYPVNTLERAKSALKLAHNAPNPGGIKKCVYRKWPQLKTKT